MGALPMRAAAPWSAPRPRDWDGVVDMMSFLLGSDWWIWTHFVDHLMEGLVLEPRLFV